MNALTNALTNDCIVLGEDYLSLEAALLHLKQHIKPVVEMADISLLDIDRHILAKDIKAKLAHPAFDNAAVDGYGVCLHDDAENLRFNVVGTAKAGHPFLQPLKTGEAIKIFTGAPIPPNCHSVYMVEDVKMDEAKAQVICPALLPAHANIRKKGEDVDKGETILQSGLRLNPADCGLAAAQGMESLPCYRPLKVGVFSTGDEIIAAGGKLQAGQIFDSNRAMLINWCRRLGALVDDLGILADDKQMIESTLDHAASHYDMLVSSGGMSMGDEDHVRNAIERIGALNFWRLAIKPGRPIGVGLVQKQNHSCLLLGLPGNVVASFVTFAFIGRFALLRLSGANPPIMPPSFSVRLGKDIRKKAGRLELIRVTLSAQDGYDTACAMPYPKEGSGILTSVANTDGLCLLASDRREFGEGDKVPFIPFHAFYC